MNTQAPFSGIPFREHAPPDVQISDSLARSVARKLRVFVVVASALLAGCTTPNSARDASPLLNAHAHNDYMHTQPLLEALDHGFCSVEADVFLVDGELLVAHDRAACRADRTIDRLYLDPLI